MTYYRQITLNIGNEGSYTFHCAYNERTNFNDLLDFIEYNYPDKNICSCFKFQYLNNGSYYDLNMNNRVYDYLYNGSYNEFKIVRNSINIRHNHRNNRNTIKSPQLINIIKRLVETISMIDPIFSKYNICETNNIREIGDLIIDSQNSIINKIKNIITNYKNEINILKKKNEEEINKLRNKEEEINILKRKNEEEINKLRNKEEEINILKRKNEEEINKKNEEINNLVKEKQYLEIAINGDIGKINELKKLGIIGEFLLPNKNIISIDNDTGQIIGKSNTNKDTNFIDFYDVIIDIKSIKDISKGWEIKMSKRAQENYEIFKNEEIIKIGVIGNSNKGKSFLLSKISKITLPSGTSIRTEGLSIKYPELDKSFKNRRIALLDSAGLETPVLKFDNKETENENTTMTEKDLFKEKSREKLITELFLQNYIIKNSDIIIIVVGILTYSEQKLLIRIKNEIKKAKINKPLYIIHNLITYVSVSQVEEYINNLLLNSATFNLVKGHIINTKTTIETGTYYYEKNVEPNIYHLIFANEGSEAGDYYNNLTLNFLENSYQNVTNLKPFDVIETVKERFMEISKEIMEKTEQPLNMNDFDNTDNKLLKLNNQSKLVLKKCLIDELGFSNLKSNGFEPTYNYYKKDDKIIVRIEGPGNCSINSFIDYSGEYTIIRLAGNKKKDKEPEKLEDNIFNTREMGDFSLDIPLKTYDYLIKNKEPEIRQQKGLLILEFQIDEKKEYKGLEIEDEV